MYRQCVEKVEELAWLSRFRWMCRIPVGSWKSACYPALSSGRRVSCESGAGLYNTGTI